MNKQEFYSWLIMLGKYRDNKQVIIVSLKKPCGNSTLKDDSGLNPKSLGLRVICATFFFASMQIAISILCQDKLDYATLINYAN